MNPPDRDVPVFTCVMNVAPPDAEGTIVARVANLDGLEGRGATEREALAQAVANFKRRVAALHASGRPIPFYDHAVPPAAGEVQRLIAVHL